jgi:hypothetical protein
MLRRIVKHFRSELAASVALLGLMAGLVSGAQAQSTPDDPIVGTWIYTNTPDEGATFTEIETYAPGGSITAIDNFAPSSQETISVGPWRKIAPLKYVEDNYQFLYDANGNFTGTFIVHAEDDLSADFKTITGPPYTYVVLDPKGKVVDRGTGTSSAVRAPKPERHKP